MQDLVDRFYAQLMLPIRSERGEVIGFGARTIDADDRRPKYINSKESALFKKGQTLYGLAIARQGARAADRTVIVEGYLDVISLHAAGVQGVVACLGTALSARQLEMAAALAPSKRIVLSLDADDAGRRAVERLAEKELPALSAQGVDVRVTSLPEGFKDPDEYVRAHGGPAFEAHVLDQATDWLEWLGKERCRSYLEHASGGGGAAPIERGGGGALFSQCVRDLSAVLKLAPAGALRAYHTHRFAEILSGGDSRFAATIESLLTDAQYARELWKKPAASAAPFGPAAAAGAPLLRRAWPALLHQSAISVDSLYVWKGRSGSADVLHWEGSNSSCALSPHRPPTIGELELPPCPLCAEAALVAAAHGAHATHAHAPAVWSELGPRAQAELLLLHALLEQPALRSSLAHPLASGANAASGAASGAASSAASGAASEQRAEGTSGEHHSALVARLTTPARSSLLRALLENQESPAASVWSMVGEGDEAPMHERWPELALLHQPPKELLEAAAAASAAAGEGASAEGVSAEGATIELNPDEARVLMRRCSELILSEERAWQLQQMARQVSVLAARPAIQLQALPWRGGLPQPARSEAARPQPATRDAFANSHLEVDMYGEDLYSETDGDAEALALAADACSRAALALAREAEALAAECRQPPPLGGGEIASAKDVLDGLAGGAQADEPRDEAGQRDTGQTVELRSEERQRTPSTGPTEGGAATDHTLAPWM